MDEPGELKRDMQLRCESVVQQRYWAIHRTTITVITADELMSRAS